MLSNGRPYEDASALRSVSVGDPTDCFFRVSRFHTMKSSFSLKWASELDRLEAMAVLLSAVEKGSLSGAARELHMPVSTLNRRITDLEEYLGTRLLTRTTRQLKLTDAGASYVASAR